MCLSKATEWLRHKLQYVWPKATATSPASGAQSPVSPHLLPQLETLRASGQNGGAGADLSRVSHGPSGPASVMWVVRSQSQEMCKQNTVGGAGSPTSPKRADSFLRPCAAQFHLRILRPWSVPSLPLASPVGATWPHPALPSLPRL